MFLSNPHASYTGACISACILHSGSCPIRVQAAWRVQASVLYDRPPAFFQRTPLAVQHELFCKLATSGLHAPTLRDWLSNWAAQQVCRFVEATVYHISPRHLVCYKFNLGAWVLDRHSPAPAPALCLCLCPRSHLTPPDPVASSCPCVCPRPVSLLGTNAAGTSKQKWQERRIQLDNRSPSGASLTDHVCVKCTVTFA